MWAGARTAGRSLMARARGVTDPEARQRFWSRTGADWFDMLSDMKGAAMKLGQLASQYEDLLPPELSEALRKLQRAAPPRPLSALDAVMAQAWSTEQRARLQVVEEPAMAAASIGQVHRARLVDGRQVALKLRYPEVRDAIDDDVAALGRLFRMARITPMDGVALNEVLAEVRARFREETDYRVELANLQRLRRDSRYDWMTLPEPEVSLCTEATLVTSWQPADDLETAKTWSQSLRDRLGDRLARWVVAQVFETGFLHADPHPGNFGFHDDGRITVYDFGCAVAIRPEAVQQMARAVRAALDGDWLALHAVLQVLGAVPDTRAMTEADAALYADVCAVLLEPLLQNREFDFADGRIIDQARAAARRHLRQAFAYRPVSELVFVMRTLSGTYWLLRSLRARVRMRALLHAVARKASSAT